MTQIITKERNKEKLNQLFEYAKSIGVEIEMYEDTEENEDIALLNAMESTRTNEFIDTEEFIRKLRK